MTPPNFLSNHPTTRVFDIDLLFSLCPTLDGTTFDADGSFPSDRDSLVKFSETQQNKFELWAVPVLFLSIIDIVIYEIRGYRIKSLFVSRIKRKDG